MIPCLLTDTVTYDIDRAVHYALLWGLEGIELRSVGGANDRIPFVNESKIQMRLREGDLPAVAVDPVSFVTHVDDRAGWMNDLVQFDETLELCKRIGCERVVVSSFLDQNGRANGDRGKQMATAAEALKQAVVKAARFDITVCVLNEHGYVASDGQSLADLLDAVGHENAKAAWSPAEALISGGDPVQGLRTLGRKIGLVRCRNGVLKGNGWEPRTIDSGEIDWAAQLEELQAAGFDGPLCLEVEAEPQAKVGLRDATTLIRMLRDVRSNAKT